MELILAFWLLWSVFNAMWYSGKGGNGFAAFVLSLMLSPLLVGLFIILSNPGQKCPQCRERIKKGAAICPHCRSNLAVPAP